MLNASLAGFLEGCGEVKDGKGAIGFRNGLEGLVKGWTVDLSEVEAEGIEALKRQPGAALGAGRFPLTEDGLRATKTVLERNHIDKLVLIGGNGSMWAAAKLAEVLPSVQVLGVPKTIDNDLRGTDHAPGYLSAAKFVAEAVRASALDLWSMRNFEQVRVIEVMGRHVGWLAAASSLAVNDLPGFPPLQIYPTERNFNLEEFVNETRQLLRDYPCLITVVSEGVHDEMGKPIVEQQIGGNGSGKIVGGIGGFLTQELRRQGIASRSETMGVLQRCSPWTVSAQDRWESVHLGREAVRLLHQGNSGIMVGLNKPGGRAGEDLFCHTPLQDVAGFERSLDSKFFSGKLVNDVFQDWLNTAWAEPLTDSAGIARVWALSGGPIKGQTEYDILRSIAN